jgi:hypothetical protein
LRQWFEDTKQVFAELEELKKETSSPEVQAQLIKALKHKEKFIENYKEVRKKAKEKIQVFTKEFQEIQTRPVQSATEFTQRKQEISDVFLKAHEFLKTIDSKKSVYIKSFWKDLFS